MTTRALPGGTDAAVTSTARDRPLVVAAHGTASEEGQAVVERCAARAGRLLGLETPPVVGYVDVCGPTLEEVLADLENPVVVPFFLASGYHVRHDVPSALAPVRGSTLTPALGAADEVVDALVDRVREVDTDESPRTGTAADTVTDAVLVVGAGSSVEAARAEVALVADRVGTRLGVVTATAFLSGPGPRAACELTRLRLAGHTRIVLATHLLSPGYFATKAHRVAAAAGALATGPLGTHDLLRDLVARRYREALATDQP
ncbi:sirohydrochlorin chelatase [Serinicoccus sp. LYQ131]|uniref:sirohydrochlorin chelatase n=1 Tax=Serinicoccus sp. LYQ131 TaxID=3378797 RepID=UPI0038538C4E